MENKLFGMKIIDLDISINELTDLKKDKKMRELSFVKPIQAWKEIKVVIKDEDEFKKIYNQFTEENGSFLEYYDIKDSIFENCIEVVQEEFDWCELCTDDFTNLIKEYISKEN